MEIPRKFTQEPEQRPIEVWRFEDAPENLRALSDHGGDEDWVAALPPEYCDDYIGWMEAGHLGGFGCCDVSEHEHPNRPGWIVKIGAHA